MGYVQTAPAPATGTTPAAAGTKNVGNDRAMLISVITQLLPYVGYPRTLTALTCLNEVVKE